ncbi:MAG: hypothetical protein DI603_08260 [Roseateles depolymerans]|uniref:YecA family protein n=1 Tax=Roseateles depolymerans TaxID=76731 RepID=A0A2W5DN66_9BURK|nr:MAG: hypothetical protein DI603_08260 [Roseateles depolymerans]
MHRPPAAEPWSDAEIEWIDGWLMAEDNGLDQPLFASEMDGFLCALLSGPQLVPPSEALRWIFDAEAGEQAPIGVAEDEVQRFVELVMKQWNFIAAGLMDGSYEPLLMLNRREDGSEVTQFSDWCVGYMTGVGLDREGWSVLLDSEQAALLHTMLMYGTEEGWKVVDSRPPSDAEHEALADALGEEACAIRDFWFLRRQQAAAPRRVVATPGRNEPCHCGSGRKYKHCHGAN